MRKENLSAGGGLLTHDLRARVQRMADACDHAALPDVGELPGICVQCVTAFAEAEVARTLDKAIDWLAHRCDYGPPCGRCTYCGVARHLRTLRPGGTG